MSIPLWTLKVFLDKVTLLEVGVEVMNVCLSDPSKEEKSVLEEPYDPPTPMIVAITVHR
jgi:hypothetical protein